MTTDSYFWIGSSHKICQDYSLAGATDNGPYAIVSDGCSSSANSDWGSRYISKAAVHSLSSFPDIPDRFEGEVIAEAHAMRKTSTLNQDALDATLVVATIKNNMASVACYGDGAFAFVYPTFIELHVISYTSGAPFYLNYISNKSRLDSYITQTNSTNSIERWIQSILIYPDGVEYQHKQHTPEVPQEPGFMMSKDLGEMIAVAVMSDGILSFIAPNDTDTTKTTKDVPVDLIVKDLLDFKNHNGVFVQRRINGFLKKCAKNGWQNTDDVSMAAISLK